MNGPEHYEEAEVLLATAQHLAARTESEKGDRLADLKDSVLSTLAAAQVHATLALAAATATLIPERDPQGNDNSKQLNDWAGAGAL